MHSYVVLNISSTKPVPRNVLSFGTHSPYPILQRQEHKLSLNYRATSRLFVSLVEEPKIKDFIIGQMFCLRHVAL